ncbi:MAG: hypothetical protein ABI538_10135 [Pseudoxanthomonas sp.]
MKLVNSWNQSGLVSIWRYTDNERNYPGWHLNADGAGCQSLLALLEALASYGTGSRSVAVTAPTKAQLRVPNNKAGLAAWVAPDRLRVTFSLAPDEWSFPPALDPAAITFGSDWVEQLREGIAGIPQRRGDYAIGDRKGGLPLWFWW